MCVGCSCCEWVFSVGGWFNVIVVVILVGMMGMWMWFGLGWVCVFVFYFFVYIIDCCFGMYEVFEVVFY